MCQVTFKKSSSFDLNGIGKLSIGPDFEIRPACLIDGICEVSSRNNFAPHWLLVDNQKILPVSIKNSIRSYRFIWRYGQDIRS